MTDKTPDDACDVRFEGKLSIQQAADVQATLESALVAQGPVQINVADVEHIDTAALQLLVAFRNSLREQGRELAWSDVPETLREFSSLLGLDDLFAALAEVPSANDGGDDDSADVSDSAKSGEDALCPVF